MSTEAPGFRRQITVRIAADEWSLLEDAAREHGSQQAAILAGLRALRRERHASPSEGRSTRETAPSDAQPTLAKPATTPSPAPRFDDADDAEAGEGEWWASLEETGGVLGLDDSGLRRRIRDSGAETRRSTEGREVRLDQVQIDTGHAAGLLRTTPETMRARGQRGDFGAVLRGGRYYFPLGALAVGVAEAADLLKLAPDEVRRRADRGELAHRRDQHGHRRIRLLDVIGQLD